VVGPHVLQPVERTQPDLDLIKQVEQGNKVRFGWRLRGIRSIGISGGRVLPFSIPNFFLSLMFRCKEQQKQLGAADEDPLAKGQSGAAVGPTWCAS